MKAEHGWGLFLGWGEPSTVTGKTEKLREATDVKGSRGHTSALGNGLHQKNSMTESQH